MTKGEKMELREGSELDEAIRKELTGQYKFNTKGVLAIFLWMVAALFALLDIMVIVFIVKGENVGSNAAGAVLFTAVAIALTCTGRKFMGKMKEDIEKVRTGRFKYRTDILYQKHHSAEKTGDRVNPLHVLAFRNPEVANGMEQVFVTREEYDGVEVGDEMYVIYLPGKDSVAAIKKEKV